MLYHARSLLLESSQEMPRQTLLMLYMLGIFKALMLEIETSSIDVVLYRSEMPL